MFGHRLLQHEWEELSTVCLSGLSGYLERSDRTSNKKNYIPSFYGGLHK